MILTGVEIKRQLVQGNIEIDPFVEEQLNPNSYDCRLAPELLVYSILSWRNHEGDQGPRYLDPRFHPQDVLPEDSLRGPYQRRWLDLKTENPVERLELGARGLVLLPGVLYLGSTVERVHSDKFVIFMEGKSSLGRLGCTAHVTAGFIDTGFNGRITCEISVIHPLRVYPQMRIAQLCFVGVQGPITLYQGKYQGQTDPVASRSWQDFKPPTP